MGDAVLSMTGGTVIVHYEKGQPILLGVGATGIESWAVLNREDMDKLFAALVLARRSSWGYG